MSDQSAILSLPYILPSQAQKHVTHNEALRLLDLVVQLSVKDRDRTAPPAAPEAGDRHIVASGGSGDWAGQDGAVALYAVGEGWVFMPPLPGWRAYVEAEAAMAVWDGSAWQSLAPEFQNLDGVGVNTGSDAVNRLAVASEASLFSHEGAGHQMKVNKAAAADTASLLFQTGWSGRAEMGTAGSDGFSIKVSADGATWHTGLSVSGTSGVVTAPQGLSADSVTGLAVQQDPFDATPGRLMTSGAFGLGGTLAICPGDDLDQAPPGSFCRFGVSSINKPGPANSAGVVITSEWSSGVRSQISHLFYPAPYRNHVFTRVMDGGSWLPWRAQLGQLNLVGAVTQDAGIPTGAVIERDVNANGEYVRFADGTQICSHAVTVQSTGATVWNFPAGFGASPRVSATPNALDPRCVSVAGIGPSGGSFRVWDLGGSRVAASVEISAIGRWF